MITLEYPKLLENFENHLDPKRSESASFLIWYLENYYRLDTREAIDCVCDQKGDKGIDGIYVNDAEMSIEVFQSKISQKVGATIGDTAPKEFFGSLQQLRSKESIQELLNSAGNQIAALLRRCKIADLISLNYSLKGIFLFGCTIILCECL